uniref:Zn(2)-C6 fungal-type domain-containing protein n=1 Tax=Kalmanozyma brasiliensis (strain GHG001) TaxID=1365824 RepID=V5ETR0_KALBG
MAMDDFGFFSEGSSSAAAAASHAQASGSKAQAYPLQGSSHHGYSHQSSGGPAKRGSNLACLKCRAIKVKCWKSNPNDPRCARCNRLDLFCEFREHHRGKKLEKVIADENRNVVLTPEMLRRARHSLLRCTSYPLSVDLAAAATADGAGDAAYLAMPATASAQSYSAMVANQTYVAAGMASSGSLSPVSSVAPASSVYDDVVRINACSWADACYLFGLFMTQLNPIAALLEPSLHTVQYVREQSPILFSTILGISSRFFRPDLLPQCQSAAAAILKHASSRPLCSVDHIQALVVTAIWAAPGDPSTTETIASAVAYAYELGLPFCFETGMSVASATNPYAPTLPPHLLQGSHQTTILRMQQRTWIQLCLLELSQQSDSRRNTMHRRPDLIMQNDLPNVRAWYELNHSTMSAYDTRLAYQLDLALSQRSFNRLAASIRTGASPPSEGELSRSFDALLKQERDCFSTWFNSYGEEYVARYGMDRYSNAEAGFVLLLYRFGRALQLYSAACSNSAGYGMISQLRDRWFATATELAFKVLDFLIAKVLDKDATPSSMLRFSPQYMASGCLSAARWLLPADSHQQAQGRHSSSTKEGARERLSEIIRLLALPQFYPDGNRVPTSSEIIGQLDQALRSLMGDAGMLIAYGGTSPKRARAQEGDEANSYSAAKPGKDGYNRDEGQGRKQRRRTSNASLARIELGAVGSRGLTTAGSAGSDRVGSEWSPHLTADRWNAGSQDGTGLNVDSHWPSSLLSMSGTASTSAQNGAGSWTPRSEGALSNVALVSSSISPPASASSAVFSVSSTALPDHVDLGLGAIANGPYGYAGSTSSISTPSLPLPASAGAHNQQARSYDRAYVPSHFINQAYPASNVLFQGEPGLSNGGVGQYQDAGALSSFPLARDNTATQQYSGATHSRYADNALPSSADLDASLSIGLAPSYGSSNDGPH